MSDLGSEPTSGWQVVHRRAPAGVLHHDAAAEVAVASRRTVRILEAETRALVLGSAQPADHVDAARAAAAGVDVVRRRSGGSAVLVGPGECVWIDVALPAGDPLWQVDVGRAAWWLGDVWARAVEAVTGDRTAAGHRAGLRRSAWSDRVCFAGLGPGEVTRGGAAGDDPTGGSPRKVVGLAQRRVRAGALFQTAALLRWDPAALADLLAVDEGRRAQAARDLGTVAAGLGPGAAGPLVEAFLAELEGIGP